MRRFNDNELLFVQRAAFRAKDLVSNFYALSPREWASIHYEVKTQKEIEPAEEIDTALAHVVCYEYIRHLDQEVLRRSDLYRICLQDNVILRIFTQIQNIEFLNFLTYVLTHEFIHVVRFAQQRQRFDLPWEEREKEEQMVEMITHQVLSREGEPYHPLRQKKGYELSIAL